MGKNKRSKRVAVGLSGGVDSAVSAALLVEQGYEVTGVHLECWSEPGCRAPQDRKDALAVAMQLGIPFEVLDFQKEYKEKVIEYFYREYEAGRTPNPDVMCNLEIKFGLFLKWAIKSGFDFMATGHYARIHKIPNSKFQITNKSQIPNSKLKAKIKYHLLRGVDKKKDQSYFLYRLGQEQLKYVLFPVGEMTKRQVRVKAKKLGLPVADKPDSQGICFIGEMDVQAFLRRRIKEKKGEVLIKINSKSQAPNFKHASDVARQILNTNIRNSKPSQIRSKEFDNCNLELGASSNYEVIGSHKGVWFYTIGQRHGFEISNKLQVTSNKFKHKMPPLYVVGKDVEQNRLIVGTEREVEGKEFEVSDLHWVGKKPKLETANSKLLVRIRHGGKLIKADLKENNKKMLVKLSKAEKGIAPGQSAVFYREDECLGGGVIG